MNDRDPARFVYPAVADSVDLPNLMFRKNRDEDEFVLLFLVDEEQSRFLENKTVPLSAKPLADSQLMKFCAPLWPVCGDADIFVRVVAHRGPLLRIGRDGTKVVIEAHWNLFIPYLYQIQELPIVHSDILDIFAEAVSRYAALAMKHQGTTRTELERLVIDAYLDQPGLVLASLDIFNKPNVYHIHPKRIWGARIYEAYDKRRSEIDASAAAADPLVRPDLLEEVAGFVHSVVKGYAFRYVDYLWTQRYRISPDTRPEADIVAREGNEIVINIHPLIHRPEWKPSLYLSLGYAIMLVILESSGGDNKKSIFLSMMKTWNRYLSFDESTERQSVRELCRITGLAEKEIRRGLLGRVTGKEGREVLDDFVTLVEYSAKETLSERMEVLKESRHPDRTGAYYEQLSDAVRSLNTILMRNNTGHAKLIEVLRNDNIDHVQLADLLLTGRLDHRNVVDVSEWLLLRTLIYDLINAPKVFSNDYTMLLQVLTKVNKSLIVFIWTLVLSNDPRCEPVKAYISEVITDIFVFDRVKIYEIVADPLECLEAEAVTGYLLNWAGLSIEDWRSIIGGTLSSLPRNVMRNIHVQTPNDVDQLIRAMTIRASGLIGFYLHQAYRWGSTEDELTDRIRSYFPELLREAQKAALPHKTAMGGAMLLLILAQIMSDERDGFASNISITEEERATVLGLIRRCIDWNQKHFVMMVGGVAAGYTGSIDGWMLQQFEALLGRYSGGDRVVLRSVVQFDVEILIQRALVTAKSGEESALVNKIQLLRLDIDPVISNQANKCLKEIAIRYDVRSPETALKKRDIRDLLLGLSWRMKT